MRRISTFLITIFIILKSFGQSDSLEARLVLIGDAGDLKNGKHPVIDAVRETVKLDKKTTVLYLGDNLYTTGLPDEQNPAYDIRRSVLDTQIAIANGTDAKVYFIPGNHDWDRGHKDGWEAILRQQEYVDENGGRNVAFYPKSACGGPVEIQLSKDALLVIFDSQWWIHPYDKPGVESDCPFKTKFEILNQLEDILSKNSKKLVILACHHPFKSFGIHGGYFTLKQHIFPLTDINPGLYIPLPVIGSIYPIVRGVFGTPQDLSHPAYQNMIRDVQKVVKTHPNVIFVSGHEHNLQYIKDSNYNYIVSGSGTKHTRVSPNKKALFESDLNGFAVLDVTKYKKADITFYTVTDSIKQAFKGQVANFSKVPLPESHDTIPNLPVPYFSDSIIVAANTKYAAVSKFQEFLNGRNYRDVWAAPVKLKIFRLNAEMGGFTITGIGGGHQTKSLKLKDKDGKVWSLRTVNKDITKILPESVQRTAAEQYLHDFISSAHPYSPLIVPHLARAGGVVVATPKIYFVPNDPTLGAYRPFFANSVCLLEEREPTLNRQDTKSEQKIINKLIDDNDNHVDQQAFLRARLLDFLIADWDRHFDQWRFAEKDTGAGKLYYPIPRDRDQAFSYSDGLLVKYASQNFIPFAKGFRRNIPAIKWLAYWAKDLDRIFLTGLDSATWQKTAAAFHSNVTDQVIDEAVKKLPPEIYAIDGKEISEKLKSRRDELPKEAIKYYKFLSKNVNIIGSNKSEFFKISPAGEDLQVIVYKRNEKTHSATVIYHRIFEHSTTKEIDLYGLNGNDFFQIDKNTSSRIKVRIIGGKGNDTFNINGRVKNYVYDYSGEKNYIINRSRTKDKFENDPKVNKFSTTGFNYNKNTFPDLNLGFNAEDGLMAGIGFTRRTYGFRKEPYSTTQKLSTLYAITSGAYKIFYKGEFNQVAGNNDLVVNGELGKPVLNNFFGIGNFTKIQGSNNVDYYRVRYNYAYADVMLRQRMAGIVSISAGGEVFNYWNHLSDNRNKILNTPSLVGLDSSNVYRTKIYGGGKINIVINNVNSEFLPTRGIFWNTDFSALAGLNKNSSPLTALSSDMTVYSSLTDPASVVSVLRLGAGHIFSKNYEYFQAMNLGQNNFLRGFRKNRFSGSSLAYGSLSLLIKLFDSKSYIFPGSVGVLVYDDVGRVWAGNQQSNKWHNALGGGFYYSPFNMVLVSAGAGFSEEEILFNFSIGTKFNLTF